MTLAAKREYKPFELEDDEAPTRPDRDCYTDCCIVEPYTEGPEPITLGPQPDLSAGPYPLPTADLLD